MTDSHDQNRADEGDSIHCPSPMPLEESALPRATSESVMLPSHQFTPEQWTTTEELLRLNSQLAGLYRLGLELLPRAEEPGVGYMIAHVGRELSRGVMGLLAGMNGALPINTDDEVPDTERNRRTISAILQLPPAHPQVTKWFQLHATFASSAHFREPGPEVENVRKAFLGLSELLFGMIGPYFATQEQLDAFLSIDAPDETVVDRVRPMLVRPVQRQYFFGRLTQPGWLSPLTLAGQFDTPPEVLDLGDGTWRPRPWPEGEYLRNVAVLKPDEVTDILLKIPKKLKNPDVWHAVARAAANLPAEFAERLTARLESALKTSIHRWFVNEVISLVQKLAESQQEGAFRLAACLLWLNKPPTQESPEAPSPHRISGRGNEWVLARLDSYMLGQLLKGPVSALESFKPYETLTLLSETLNRASKFIESAEGSAETFKGSSTYWCRRLTSGNHNDDVRGLLAVKLTAVAIRVAALGEDQTASVLKMLGGYRHEIFQRIRLAVVTAAGHLAVGHLDEIIADPNLLESPPSTQEYASLLRAQFNNASLRSQRIFSYALERGPTPEQVSNVLTSRKLDPTEESVREVVAHWQRRRLLWFHDQIPAILMPLAEKLGVIPRKPDEEERALNEEGFYIGGGLVGEASSDSDEKLPEMTADAIISYIESEHSDETVDPEELSDGNIDRALAQYIAEHSEDAGELTTKLIKPTANPHYVSAVLGGFKEALEKDRSVPWRQALDLAAFAVNRAAAFTGETGKSNVKLLWNWSEDAAARLIQKGCIGNHIPHEEANSVWRVLSDALTSPATWEDSDNLDDYKTFDAIISAAINTRSGRFVETLVSVALWEYRRAHPEAEGQQSRDSSAIAWRLVPLLEVILARGGRAGLAAQAMLGHFIPHIHLMARAWTLESGERLFGGGAASPLTRPLWGAYVTWSRLYNNVFRDLRPWYVVAADVLDPGEGEAGSPDDTWSPSRHLVNHVLMALLRGIAAVGDSDQLVERTFSNANPTDRSHAYWGVFRSWSDSNGQINQEVTERLVRFWEWRLDQLETLEDPNIRRKEAIGLRWLIATPYVPTADSLRLGKRTLDLTGDDVEERGAPLWERLAKLAELDAAGTYEIVELLIHEALARDYNYLPYPEVSSTLSRALKSDNAEIKKRAERLINTLGDRGLFTYGELLKPEDANDGSDGSES